MSTELRMSAEADERVALLRSALHARLDGIVEKIRARVGPDWVWPRKEELEESIRLVDEGRDVIVNTTVDMVSFVVDSVVDDDRLYNAVLQSVIAKAHGIAWAEPWRVSGPLVEASMPWRGSGPHVERSYWKELAALRALLMYPPRRARGAARGAEEYEDAANEDDDVLGVRSAFPFGEHRAVFFVATDAAPAAALRLAIDRVGLFRVTYDTPTREHIARQGWWASQMREADFDIDEATLAAGPPSYGDEVFAEAMASGGYSWALRKCEGVDVLPANKWRCFPSTLLFLVGNAYLERTTPEALASHAANLCLSKQTTELARHEHAQRELEEMLRARMPDGAIDDVNLCALVAHYGDHGREVAAEIEARVARGEPPKPGPLRVPLVLAKVLWLDVICPRLERGLTRRDAPGLAMPILTNVVRASRRGAQTSLFDGVAEIVDAKGKRVGSLVPTSSPTIDSKHVSLANLGRLCTQRLVRFVLHQGYRQKWVDQTPDATRIVIDGGFPALAATLGMTGKKAATELKGAVETLSALRIDTPRGEGQVFAFWHYKATGHRRAILHMNLLGPFAPDYISNELAGHRTAQDKYLVPVPLPELLPPMTGREKDHAAQAFLQVLVLREMRMRAEELAEHGCVEINERTWRALGDEAGLPQVTLNAVLDIYPRGSAGRPAFLTRTGGWLFDLAEAYGPERQAIVAAGDAMKKGRSNGQKAAAQRRNGGRKPKG